MNLIGCTWGRIRFASQTLIEDGALLDRNRLSWCKTRKLRTEGGYIVEMCSHSSLREGKEVNQKENRSPGVLL